MLKGSNLENQIDAEADNKQDSPEGPINSLLATLPLIRKAVKKGLFYSQQAAEDVSQKVLINLWRWHSKDPERSLSDEELKKIAVRSAQNEAKLFHRLEGKKNQSTAYLEELTNSPADLAGGIEGNTEREVNSLAMIAWNEIRQLSLRQKYALLMQKQELIFYLVGCGCCQSQEIADSLGLPKERFAELFKMLPIADERISEIYFEVTGEKLTPKQIWEARSKARAKLAKVLR